MGAVFKPSDFVGRRRRFVSRALDDLGPRVREAAREILEHWEEGKSEEELRRLLGEERTRALLEGLRAKRED